MKRRMELTGRQLHGDASWPVWMSLARVLKGAAIALGLLAGVTLRAFAGGAGDLNCDNSINTSDLVALTQYLVDGIEPAAQFNSDVNNDCCVTQADRDYLADFLFSGGPRPVSGCNEPLLMMPGDVNCDFTIDNSDVVALTAILAGNIDPCQASNADVNGDCCINDDDRVALVDFLFTGGPAPADCTCHQPGVMPPGDVNCDGVIDTADLAALADMLSTGMPFGSCPIDRADVNGNGCVTQQDLDELSAFLFTAGPIATCGAFRPLFPVSHIPGDANSDNVFDVSDVVFLQEYLTVGGAAPSPIANGDANGDCCVNLDDVDYLSDFLFTGGPALPECTCDSQLTECGDADGDGVFNIADVTTMINRIFSCAVVSCMVDATGDQAFDISDVTAGIKRIFNSGPPLKC